MRLIIIGNGIAGLSAAEAFRKVDTESEIILLSQEPYLTYQRIKLSHVLGEASFTDTSLLVKPESWYASQKIEVRLSTEVIGIDYNAKQVTLKDSSSLDYDKLLLATGGHAFMPPVKGCDKAGIFALRTLDDLKKIQSYLEGKQRVVVVGGGLLGLEAAHGLIALGKQVTVLEFFPYLLPRQLDQEISLHVQAQLEKEGIQFVLNTGCDAIIGDEFVTGIHLANGEILEADTVIFSVGVRSNISLFENSPLEINKGVVVNDKMQTSLPDVYAAGDLVEYQGVVFGLWTASNEHGRIAGSNLAGKEMTYASPQLVATLNIGEVKLFSAGDVSVPEQVITYKDDKVWHRLFIKEGHVVGAVLTGDLALMLKAKNAVKNKNKAEADADFMSVLG